MKMLLRCIRFLVSMFIVLLLCQELASFPLFFNRKPYMDEFTIEEGEPLLITYKVDRILKFVYPDVVGKPINTSKISIYYNMNNVYQDSYYYDKNDTYGYYYYQFKRPITVFRDTGWYGCSYHNFESSTNSSTNIEMNWLYVYIKSNTNLFVEAHSNVHLSAIVGGSIVIPCRTTWPDLKPILINGNQNKLNDVSFDPKIGFTIRNLSLEDSNRYKCLIEKDGKKHTVSYVLSVLKQILPEPKIQVNDLYITYGQDLKINCTVEMKLPTEYKFDWNIPQQNSSNRSIQQFIKQFDKNTVTSQLTVFNVTDENKGNYECIVRSNYDIKKIKKNIMIWDPVIKPIEFSSEFNTSYLKRKDNSYFNLTVHVSAIMDTSIEWLYSQDVDRFIITSAKYITIREHYYSHGLNSYIHTFSSLIIEKLSFEHSSTYTIRAKNDYTIEIMNFTLEVVGKPRSIDIKSYDRYYAPYESTKFHCKVSSHPPPKITWSFRKCSNFSSCENSTFIPLTNVTENVNESTVTMFIEMSGQIKCKACNAWGCTFKTQNITVPDPVPPFFVKTNINETKIRIIDMITEGQSTVILQCFADGMPKPKIAWYKDNVLLRANDQYYFKHQELHIRYLNLNNSGNYSCRASNAIATNEIYQQIIVKNTKPFSFDVLIISLPILGFILVILVISATIKIYREKKMRRYLMEIGLMHFEEGALECLNPNLTVDDQAELLPYNKKWEFPRDRLILKEQLGSGHFGMVMKAEAIGICKNENITTVAVKMVRRTTNAIYIRALTSELKIMVHLGKHLNVVNLLGAYTKNISKCELLVIVEYCCFGNLHNYLLKHRNDFINQINPKTGKHDFTIGKDILTRTINVSNDSSLNTNSDIDVTTHYSPRTNADSPETTLLPDYVLSSSLSQSEWRPNDCNVNKDHNPICTKDLLSWAFQVARGMEYLSQRKILHGDLAARNILLADDNIVKICDFGLAKTIYKDGNYKKKSNDPVPIKWMAIESIRDQIFSTQSDVWSFGIMLWEFFTLAETPYPGMEVEEQYQKLIENYRMEQPDYTIREVYDIMLQCWTAKPTLRPSFTDLAESVGNLLEESVRTYYITLNNSYMDINMMNLKNDKNDYLMMMSAPDHELLSLPTYKRVNSLFSNETSDSSDLHMNCPTDESKILIPHSDDTNTEVPSPTSNSEETINLSPLLKHEEDPYWKPINVHERRAEFTRQRQAMKNQMADRLIDQNFIYCNAPRNSLDKTKQHERD